jgi:alpha-tubulin suppressor-like RCC1 family protein
MFTKYSILFTFILATLYIPQLPGQSWQQVSCGSEFTLALRDDGTLWSWGFNGNGQLGLGDTETRMTPEMIGEGHDWRSIEAGGFHAFAIRNDGTLWGWGLNGNGQVGLGCGSSTLHQGELVLPDGKRAPDDMQYDSPQQVGEDTDWHKISAGFIHTLALKTDSTLWAWGENYYGSIGDSSYTTQCLPVQIAPQTKWVDIANGGLHSLALDEYGQIWSWGSNGNGQLGTGSPGVNSNYPVLIERIDSVVQIDAGLEYGLALRTDGSLWSWGFNGNGQLGLGNTIQQNIPTRIGTETNWRNIMAGSVFCFALNEQDSLFGWGFNMQGNLGLGHISDVWEPTPIVEAGQWKQVSAAEGSIVNIYLVGSHSVGIRKNETGLCSTGSNYIGQLGDSTTINRNTFICDINPELANREVFQYPVTLYPNPARDRVQVELPYGSSDKVSLEIVDTMGKRIRFFEDRIPSNLRVNTMPPGIYLVRIMVNGAMQVEKLVIQ